MEDESDDCPNSFEIASELLESCNKLANTTDLDTVDYGFSSSHQKATASNSERRGKRSHLFDIVSVLKELAEIVTGHRIRRRVDRAKDCQERTHILDIPNEILSQIFWKYFSYLELCLLRSVCSRFSDVASGVLETGFINVIRDIAQTLEDIHQRLIVIPETEKSRISCYSLKTVTLLQTYNILEIILSDLIMLKAVTGAHMCHSSMFSATAYLLEKSSQILRMLQHHYREEPNNCPSLCTADQLSSACNHFLSSYEDRKPFSDEGRSLFGPKMVDVLDCSLNADSQLTVWCEGARCYVKGNYLLWEHETTPPEEETARSLAGWLKDLRFEIQEANTNFVQWKNREAKTALVINSVTGGSLVDCLKDLLLNWSDLTRVDHSGKYTMVRREVPKTWRKKGGTKIEFELECHVSEAPNCVTRHVNNAENIANLEFEVNCRFNWSCKIVTDNVIKKDNS